MLNSDIDRSIEQVKKDRKAVILAHFYQPSEIQEIADFVGDSLELSRFAKETDAGTIVFCGVSFMAETAKILDPERIVLLPVPSAGCQMADMLTVDMLAKLKAEHPEAAVVCYINSSAEIKAMSDICCTSSNAVKIIGSISSKEIIFVPDRNLGRYAESTFPDKKFYFCEGHCPVHNELTPEDTAAARQIHPNAKVLVHPECTPEVIASADFTGSTAQIISYACDNSPGEFIIGTEEGILHQLKKLCPESFFYPLKGEILCDDMKLITKEDVLSSLKETKYKIEVDSKVAAGALKAIEAMLKIK